MGEHQEVASKKPQGRELSESRKREPANATSKIIKIHHVSQAVREDGVETRHTKPYGFTRYGHKVRLENELRRSLTGHTMPALTLVTAPTAGWKGAYDSG